MRLILAIVSLLLVPSFASASDTPRILPEYIACTYHGKRYACYTKAQQVQLNLLEATVQNYHRQRAINFNIYKDLEQINSTLLTITAELTAIQKKREKHLEEMTNRVIKEIELKNEYRAKVNPWKWPLILGGTVGALASGVLIGFIVSAR